MSFSSPLLNYVESIDINGNEKTKFFTEVNTELSPGDKVHIVNGLYDNKKIIEQNPYTKGADGWTVLLVEDNEIVLDIDYTGQLPTLVTDMDEFVKVWGINDTKQLEYQKSYSKVFSSYINAGATQSTQPVDLINFSNSDLSIPLPSVPTNSLSDFQWKLNGSELTHIIEYIDPADSKYKNLQESSTLVVDTFGFDIVEEAEIKGVEVTIKKGLLAPTTTYNASDVSIKLSTLSDGLSDNKSGGDSWSIISGTNYTTKDTTYGSLTDNWGYESVSAIDINDNSFSINFRAVVDDFELDFDPSLKLVVYNIDVTVSYQVNDYLFSQTKTRFTQEDNSALFISEEVSGTASAFFKEITVGNTQSSTELSNDITSQFETGNLTFGNGKILVMEPFVYDGIEFHRGVKYKFEDKWVEDEDYKLSMIGKNVFRGGSFKGGSWDEGIFGDYRNEVVWEGADWNQGILYNATWNTGVMGSQSDADDILTTTAYLKEDGSGVRKTQEIQNNNGYGLNYIIDSKFIEGTIQSSNILNSKIGLDSASFSNALDVIYTGATESLSVSIGNANIQQSSFDSTRISDGVIYDSNIENSILDSIETFDTKYNQSSITNSDIKNEGTINVIGYNRWYTSEPGFRSHVTHKFYISEDDFFKVKYGDPIYLNSLIWGRLSNNNLTIDNEVLNLFDDEFWMLFGNRELEDNDYDQVYGYLKEPTLNGNTESLLVSYSTKGENNSKSVLTSTSKVVSTNEYQLPSINITLSVFANTLLEVDIIDSMVNDSNWNLRVLDFSNAKIQKGDIKEANITNSEWFNGTYTNRKDLLINSTTASIGTEEFFVLDIIGSTNSLTLDLVPQDLNPILTDLWSDDNLEIGDYVTTDNLIYVNGTQSTNISELLVVSDVSYAATQSTIKMNFVDYVDPIWGGEFRSIVGFTRINKVNFDQMKISGGLLKWGKLTNSEINNVNFLAGDEELTKSNIDLLRISGFNFFNRNEMDIKTGTLHSCFLYNDISTIRENIFPGILGGTQSKTLSDLIIDSSYMEGFTANNIIFNQGYWVDGIFDKGSFINSKSSGTTIQDNEASPINNGDFSMFSKRWVRGDWINGRFINSTWASGLWERGEFIKSHFLSGTWENGRFGLPSLKTSDTIFFSGDWLSGRILKGTFGQDTDSVYKAFNISPTISATHASIWEVGVFEDGLVTGNSNAPIESTIWKTGVFNNGEFGGKAIWYDGRFNNGRFTSHHHSFGDGPFIELANDKFTGNIEEGTTTPIGMMDTFKINPETLLLQDWPYNVITGEVPLGGTGSIIELGGPTYSPTIIGVIGSTVIGGEGIGEGGTYSTTSTTIFGINLGTQSFDVDTNLDYVGIEEVTITFDPTNYMIGNVATYSPISGSMSVIVNETFGSGTYSSWDIEVEESAPGLTYSEEIYGLTDSSYFEFASSGVIGGLDNVETYRTINTENVIINPVYTGAGTNGGLTYEEANEFYNWTTFQKLEVVSGINSGDYSMVLNYRNVLEIGREYIVKVSIRNIHSDLFGGTASEKANLSVYCGTNTIAKSNINFKSIPLNNADNTLASIDLDYDNAALGASNSQLPSNDNYISFNMICEGNTNLSIQFEIDGGAVDVGNVLFDLVDISAIPLTKGEFYQNANTTPIRLGESFGKMVTNGVDYAIGDAGVYRGYNTNFGAIRFGSIDGGVDLIYYDVLKLRKKYKITLTITGVEDINAGPGRVILNISNTRGVDGTDTSGNTASNLVFNSTYPTFTSLPLNDDSLFPYEIELEDFSPIDNGSITVRIDGFSTEQIVYLDNIKIEESTPSINSYDWLTGDFINGEFGTALTGDQENSIWKDGTFNDGKFIGRTWVDGEFKGGRFVGSLQDEDYFDLNYEGITQTELDSKIQLMRNFEPQSEHYGNWINGKVFPTSGRNDRIIFSNMMWNNGIFDSASSIMKNSIWLNGEFNNGSFQESAFNPYVWRFNPIDGSIPNNTDVVSANNRLGFNTFPYDTCGEIGSTSSVPTVWNNGDFLSGQFYMSDFNKGKIIDGEFNTARITGGLIKYGDFNNSLIDTISEIGKKDKPIVRWRNGNWNGSTFRIDRSINNAGVIDDRFINSQLIMNQLRDETYADGRIHFWNVFRNDFCFYRTQISSLGTPISTGTNIIIESIDESYKPVSFYYPKVGKDVDFDDATYYEPGKSLITKSLFLDNGDYIVIGEFENAIQERGSIQQFNRIAKIKANGDLDKNFNINSTIKSFGQDNSVATQNRRTPFVYDMVKTQDHIVLVGYFEIYNDISVISPIYTSGIKWINHDGTITNIGSSFEDDGGLGVVKTIDTQSDGKLIVGGKFDQYAGVGITQSGTASNENLARLNTNGTLDTSFGHIIAPIDGDISLVNVLSDDSIIIVGAPNDKVDTADFTQTNSMDLSGEPLLSYGGVSSNYMCLITENGLINTSFVSGFLIDDNIKINTIAEYFDVTTNSTKLYIGGYFDQYQFGSTEGESVDTYGLIRINIDGSYDDTFEIPTLLKWTQTEDTDPDDEIEIGDPVRATVNTIKVLSNGDILIGGDFDNVNGEDRLYVATLNNTGVIRSFETGEFSLNSDNFRNDGTDGFNNELLTSYAVMDITIDPNTYSSDDMNFIISGNIIEYNGIYNNSAVKRDPQGEFYNTVMPIRATINNRTVVKNRFDDFIENSTSFPLEVRNSTEVPSENWRASMPFNRMTRAHNYLKCPAGMIISYFDEIAGNAVGVAEIGKQYKIDVRLYFPNKDHRFDFYDGAPDDENLIVSLGGNTVHSWKNYSFTYTTKENTSDVNFTGIPQGAFTIQRNSDWSDMLDSSVDTNFIFNSINVEWGRNPEEVDIGGPIGTTWATDPQISFTTITGKSVVEDVYDVLIKINNEPDGPLHSANGDVVTNVESISHLDDGGTFSIVNATYSGTDRLNAASLGRWYIEEEYLKERNLGPFTIYSVGTNYYEKYVISTIGDNNFLTFHENNQNSRLGYKAYYNAADISSDPIGPRRAFTEEGILDANMVVGSATPSYVDLEDFNYNNIKVYPYIYYGTSIESSPGLPGWGPLPAIPPVDYLIREPDPRKLIVAIGNNPPTNPSDKLLPKIFVSGTAGNDFQMVEKNIPVGVTNSGLIDVDIINAGGFGGTSVSGPEQLASFVVGGDGLILKTMDNGENWIQDNDFFDPDGAPIVIEQSLNSVSMVRTKTDGGTSSFPDNITAYAVGDEGLIMRTENYGASWSVISASGIGAMPDFTETLNSIKVVPTTDTAINNDPSNTEGIGVNIIYAVGDNDSMVVSEDDGVTWRQELTGANVDLIDVDAVKEAPNEVFVVGPGIAIKHNNYARNAGSALIRDLFVTAIDGDPFSAYWKNGEFVEISSKSDELSRNVVIERDDLFITDDASQAISYKSIRSDNGDGVTVNFEVDSYSNYDENHFTIDPVNNKRVSNSTLTTDIGYFGQYTELLDEYKLKSLHLIRSTGEAPADQRPWLDGFDPRFTKNNKEVAYALDYKWNTITSKGFPVLFNGDVNGYTFTKDDVNNAIIFNGDADNIRVILEIVYDGSGTLGVLFDNTNDIDNVWLGENPIQMLSILEKDANGGYGKSMIKNVGRFIGGFGDVIIIPDDLGFDDRYASIENIVRLITNIDFNIVDDSPRFHQANFDTETYIETNATFIGSKEIQIRRAPSTDVILNNLENGRTVFEYNEDNREILEGDDRNLVDIIYQDVTDCILPYNTNVGDVINNRLIQLNENNICFDEPISIDNIELNVPPINVLTDSYSDLSFIDSFGLSDPPLLSDSGISGLISIQNELGNFGPFNVPVMRVDVSAEIFAEINYGPILSPGTTYQVTIDINSIDLSAITERWKAIILLGGVPFEIDYTQVDLGSVPIFLGTFTAQALNTDLSIKFINSNFWILPCDGIYSDPTQIPLQVLSNP